MRILRTLVASSVLMTTFGTAALAQEAPPQGPFKTVHLTNLTAADLAALQATIADINAVMAKAGHTEVRYRLFKVSGKQAGAYAYMWEASWPGGDVYEAIHKNPDVDAAWNAAGKKYPQLETLFKEEIYNRYEEVPLVKR